MKFGAIMGQAVGEQGQTYAMPSKDMENFKKYVDDFLVYAKQHPEYTFLVTEIGCGISGHSPSEIAPLFKEALKMNNIHLPLVFWDILNKRAYQTDSRGRNSVRSRILCKNRYSCY